MKTRITLLLVALSTVCSAQEFRSTLWIEAANGRIDSVTIGYDPSASESIDASFGAQDITDQAWSDFEIRASQVDISEIINGEDIMNPRSITDLSRYQSKTEIIPKKCDDVIHVSNQSGFSPFIALFISTDSYPITLRWNQDHFDSSCLNKSVISDWPISTWWDIPCCTNLDINNTSLAGQDEITITRHVGMQVVNENQDALIMLNIALVDENSSSTHLASKQDISLSPNPATGMFQIPEQAELIRVVDSAGKIVSYRKKGNTILVDQEGLLFVQMKTSDGISTKKLINTRK